MAIDITGLENAIIKTVSTFIGNKLSLYGSPPNDKPAVISHRKFSSLSQTAVPMPDYPYASVDHTRTANELVDLVDRCFDEDGNYVYTSNKLVSFKISITGTSKNDVLSICNEMHMLLEVDEVRGMITNQSPIKTRLRSKTDPVFSATGMQDKYREVATFDVILAVVDQVVVPADPLNPPTEYNAIVGAGVEAVDITNIELDTSVEVDGVRGGIDKDADGTPNPELDISVSTDVTYP